MNMSDKLCDLINKKITKIVYMSDEKKSEEYVKGRLDSYLDVLECCNELDREDLDKMLSVFERNDLNIDIKKARAEIRGK